MKRLRVLMTRQEIVPERFPGATAVVIDVFMATTTLLTILENGARRIFPVASLEEAEALRLDLDAARLVCGGEQDAERIAGYDGGPFPEEYPPRVVEEKDVIFLTTNGTRAIAGAAPAEKVLLGCLRNAPAVARYLMESGTDSIYLVCAGSGGRFNLDDFLGAAAVISYMDEGNWSLNDGAWMALDFARRYHGRLGEALEHGRAARWFVENERTETLEFVADVGASETVPEVEDGQLHRAGDPVVASRSVEEEEDDLRKTTGERGAPWAF